MMPARALFLALFALGAPVACAKPRQQASVEDVRLPRPEPAAPSAPVPSPSADATATDTAGEEVCSDSNGCARGELCCEQMWGSGQPTRVMCVSSKAPRRFTCDYKELCTSDASCRTPRTRCQNGECVIAEARSERPFACGARACRRDAPSCCAGGVTPSCAKECGPGEEVSCTRGSDCAEGEFCAIVPLGGSFCTHLNDGMMRAACAGARDCDLFCEDRGKPRGEPGGWRRTCTCE